MILALDSLYPRFMFWSLIPSLAHIIFLRSLDLITDLEAPEGRAAKLEEISNMIIVRNAEVVACC